MHTQISRQNDVASVQEVDFSKGHIDLIRRKFMPNAGDDDVMLYVEYCKRAKLDPFVQQIHAIERKGKYSYQVGIDGLRLIADRTGKYIGQTPAFF